MFLRLGCECGEQRWTEYTRPPRRVGLIDVCPNCGESLGNSPAEAAPGGLLSAQRVVDAALDSRSGALFDESVSTGSWFQSLTCSAALSSIALQVGNGRLRTRPSVIPVDPTECGDVLTLAVNALSSEDKFRSLCADAIVAHRGKGQARFTLGPDVVSVELAGLWEAVEAGMRYQPGFRYQGERLSRGRVSPMEREGRTDRQGARRT